MDINTFLKRIFSARKSHFHQHKEKARFLIHSRLQYYAPICGVAYKRVSIRNQRRRWGSCSSLGNLNFNYRLIFLPQPLCDYVIVHELCHLKQMNHGKAFWDEVESVLPEYRILEGELKKIEKLRGVYLEKPLPLTYLSTYYDKEMATNSL